jgi:photosystem II stability/assembly factor-like uncharacterized protein
MKAKYLILFLSLFYYGNANSQWTVSETGLAQVYTSISAVNEVWTSGHLGVVARTVNGGTSWNLCVVGDSLSLENIYAIDENTALVIARDYSPDISMIWRTSNGGATWVQVHEQSVNLNAIEVNPSGTGLCVGNAAGGRWSILKTTNFGTSWDTAGMFLAGSGNGYGNCLYSNGSDYWFGASAGRLFRTSNNGASWDSVIVGSSTVTNLWFNGETGIISAGQKYRSTDGGLNWTPITHPASFFTPTAGIGDKFWQVSAGSIFIYISTDNGITWTTTNTIETKTDIAISRTGGTVWIATVSDRILHNSTGVGISTISSELPDGFSLSQNYPNPFNPSTKIKFDVFKSSFVKLAVYDILGREVSSLVNQQLQAGTYEYEFNAAALNSGTYYYRISTDNFSEIKKMVLIK